MKKLYPLALFMLLFVQFSIANDFRVVGYLPYYRFSLSDQIAYEKLTHLCLAFANPDMDGNLDIGGQDITPIVQAAHAEDVEVLISLAGGALTPAWASAWATLTQPLNRSDFIHKIIQYTLDHNLQGVDVDLEWSHVDHNYSGFVLELRDSIDAHGLLMTAALPGTYRYPEISDAAMFSYDFINMMVYDLTGPWAPNNPGPHSPYSFAQNAITYWTQQGMAPEDLTLGVPFYGYDFADQNDVHSVTYGSMVALDPAYAQLDQVGEAYYNGIPTIQAKTELALDELSGIMIWELGQDAFNEYSLLNVIDETINGITATEELAAYGVQYSPNPFRQQLRLQSEESEAIQMQLLDASGRVLKTGQLPGQSSMEWNTHDLRAGFYVLRLIGSRGIHTVKLIKS